MNSRPESPTPNASSSSGIGAATARRLALVWGVHPVPFDEVQDVGEMIAHATDAARREQVAAPGDTVVVIAGIPFGQRGSTNLLHVVHLPDAG